MYAPDILPWLRIQDKGQICLKWSSW